jgi:ABC-type oligopeptide transport system ATPase subunit
MALLEIRDLKKYFPAPASPLGRAQEHVKAIDGVSLDVDDGETVGLVGESGCGKTTLGRCIVRLIEPSSGTVTFEGRSYPHCLGRRCARCAGRCDYLSGSLCIAQSAHASRVKSSARLLFTAWPGPRSQDTGLGLLMRVGLRRIFRPYPHEFSSGQRQRIGIARALAVNAKFIVADEAVSALDVSIQTQILNMLLDLQQELGLTIFSSRTTFRRRARATCCGDVSRQDR